MRTVIVIQARTGSSRLPGKVLLPLAGKTLLERMIERVSASSLADEIVIATTIEPQDDPIESLCASTGVRVFRGHPTDLLDRHHAAGKLHGADIVVKIPSDCPLIDPAVIDRVIGTYLEAPDAYDFVSNLHPATYPDGNDVEVLPMHILHTAWLEACRDYEREHTTPFIWEHPERFRIGNVRWESGLDYSMSHRVTIDYIEDYQCICRIFEDLYTNENPIFSLAQIVELLESKPHIAKINNQFAGVNWYRDHLDELRTITHVQTRIAPNQLFA
ncbi:MAG: glycosyltransferase family protein [Bacteroidetes bacterium]|nr:glycosyltransferase family protein [Bacteroidota bacterium]